MITQAPERHEADTLQSAEHSVFCRGKAPLAPRTAIPDALCERFAAFFAADFAAAMIEHHHAEDAAPVLVV